jgi:phosphatidylserine decarboxylase
MRIPLTKYGWPEVVIFPVAILAIMAGIALGTPAVLPAWVIMSIEVLLAAILIWILCFFRDPERICPTDSNLLLAPADGQITDIETLEDPPAFLREQGEQSAAVLRIGIFLSIFNTHINRAPCNVKVGKITYKKGKYKQLTGGEKFGMLKFGSRTELYVPLCENAKCMVKTGDKVKAGLTPLVKYEI